ncbi:MAG: hypothetical protein IGQ45_14335 [Cyanobacterium sp. T60_A2020_053]|nr:hypothetical protein [Cyanobacterium sp. T60_A2020_053]
MMTIISFRLAKSINIPISAPPLIKKRLQKLLYTLPLKYQEKDNLNSGKTLANI